MFGHPTNLFKKFNRGINCLEIKSCKTNFSFQELGLNYQLITPSVLQHINAFLFSVPYQYQIVQNKKLNKKLEFYVDVSGDSVWVTMFSF